MHIAFGDTPGTNVSDNPLVPIKNHLCCPTDGSPLVKFVDARLEIYECSIVCKACNTQYCAHKEPIEAGYER